MSSVLVNTETGEILNVLSEGEEHMPISMAYPFRLVNAPEDVNRFWEYNPETATVFKPSNYLAKIKAAVLNDLATFRWTKEIVGIPYEGYPIATDRSSQAMINGAYSYALLKQANNEEHTFSWKLANGLWTQFQVEDVIAIAGLVAAHIQDCFDKEKAAAQKIIDATTDTALLNFDFETEW